MDIAIHNAFPHRSGGLALAFYRDTLGFRGAQRRRRRDHALAHARCPRTGRVAGADPAGGRPGITDDERRAVTEMMAKGTRASPLASRDLDGTFDELAAAGVEVVQEPTDQPLRDP